MRSFILPFVLFILIGIQIQSCKDCEPVPGSVNTLQVGFYSYDSLISQNDKRAALIMTFDEVSATSTDSVFYDDLDSLSEFSFTLSNLTTSTIYTFSNSSGTTDTLQIDYFTQVVVDGPDCGLREVYKNISVGKSTFDSTNVVKTTLELTDDLHVEVFTD